MNKTTEVLLMKLTVQLERWFSLNKTNKSKNVTAMVYSAMRSVIVNFMHQPHWVTECPDVQSNIITRHVYAGVSGRQ